MRSSATESGSGVLPRFTDRIQAGDTVRDVVHRYPQTRQVFEAAGIRLSCFDCAIRTAALRGGIDLPGLLAELDRAVFHS